MKTRKAINFYGAFTGLYEWGKGWISHEKKMKWDYWWKYEFPKTHHTHWQNYIEGSMSGECGRLVGTGEAVYMHPMAIYGTFVESGLSRGRYIDGVEYRYVFYEDLKELTDICKEVAEYCGGDFVMDTTREFLIEEPDERFDLIGEKEYMENCAERVERK